MHWLAGPSVLLRVFVNGLDSSRVDLLRELLYNSIHSWNLSVRLWHIRYGHPPNLAAPHRLPAVRLTLSPSVSPGFPELILIPHIHAFGHSLHLQKWCNVTTEGRAARSGIHTRTHSFCPAVQPAESRCFSQFSNSSSVMNFTDAVVFFSMLGACYT